MRETKKDYKFNNVYESLTITVVYCVFGILWILLSDNLLGFLIKDPEIYMKIQTLKGWGYVIITTLLIYSIVQKRMSLIKKSNFEAFEAYEKIEFMSLNDKLTNLPNKARLEIEVEKLILEQKNQKFAIIYIDIDKFKYINDTLGHNVGDLFLKYIAEKLIDGVSKDHFIARISGDEFAIIIQGTSSHEKIIEKVREIKTIFGKNWEYKNYQFYISVSVGVAVYPENGDDINFLLKNAEMAMYKAKKKDDNRIIFYNDSFMKDNEQHIEIANKIQSAKDNNEFELYYQPQYSIGLKKVIGVEVLTRWYRPGEGFISPGIFIPIAEETGQIYNLEIWIFENALAQKKQWEKDGLGYIEMSVNLSAKTLLSIATFDKLEALIYSYDINYSNLIIEITETAIIDNFEIVIERLKRLKEIGLKISLDDFGTGYSSFTYIKELPIDTIKLDYSFIKVFLHNEKDAAIIKAIMLLAHDLKYEVVAEGVESMEQIDYLEKYSCNSLQGNIFSEAIPAKDVTELIKTNSELKI